MDCVKSKYTLVFRSTELEANINANQDILNARADLLVWDTEYLSTAKYDLILVSDW